MKTSLTNFISKLLFADKEESYKIVTYIDIQGVFSHERIFEYMYAVVEAHPLLKQKVEQNGNSFAFLEQEGFSLKDQYEIISCKKEIFDTYISKELNAPFQSELSWKFLWCQDAESQKQRLIFSIHHGYADGYKLIEILTSPFKIESQYSKIKRETTFLSYVYFWIVGTLSLSFLTLSLIFQCFARQKKFCEKKKATDIIICKPLSLSRIKKASKQNKCTVNDILYSILLRADFSYYELRRDVFTVSPVNISSKEKTNNLMPILMLHENWTEKEDLLKSVHELFDCYKYSLFLPFLAFLLHTLSKIMPISFFSYLYDVLIDQTNYTYSNMIGPSKETLIDELEDIHFVTKVRAKEIVYNCISFQDSININLTFQEGTIQDKERFEQCIYKAYEELTS